MSGAASMAFNFEISARQEMKDASTGSVMRVLRGCPTDSGVVVLDVGADCGTDNPARGDGEGAFGQLSFFVTSTPTPSHHRNPELLKGFASSIERYTITPFA
jgi:hypothetical protein